MPHRTVSRGAVKPAVFVHTARAGEGSNAGPRAKLSRFTANCALRRDDPLFGWFILNRCRLDIVYAPRLGCRPRRRSPCNTGLWSAADFSSSSEVSCARKNMKSLREQTKIVVAPWRRSPTAASRIFHSPDLHAS